MRSGSQRSGHARGAALTLVALGLAGTAGCGQSGPLTLPGKHTETAGDAGVAARRQTQSGDKKKDKDKSTPSAHGR